MKRRFVNTFGALTYLVIILEWTWLFMLYIPLLLQHHMLDWVVPKANTATAHQFQASVTLPSLLALILACVITALVIGITLYILVKIPSTAVKKSHLLAAEASEKIIPILTHHKPVSKKRRLELSARIIMYIKLSFIVLAVCLLIPTQFIQIGLSPSISLLVGCLLACIAMISLALQLFFARVLRIPPKQLL